MRGLMAKIMTTPTTILSVDFSRGNLIDSWYSTDPRRERVLTMLRNNDRTIDIVCNWLILTFMIAPLLVSGTTVGLLFLYWILRV